MRERPFMPRLGRTGHPLLSGDRSWHTFQSLGAERNRGRARARTWRCHNARRDRRRPEEASQAACVGAVVSVTLRAPRLTTKVASVADRVHCRRRLKVRRDKVLALRGPWASRLASLRDTSKAAPFPPDPTEGAAMGGCALKLLRSKAVLRVGQGRYGKED
jgi:hypothetical protein